MQFSLMPRLIVRFKITMRFTPRPRLILKFKIKVRFRLKLEPHFAAQVETEVHI